jgi:FG-GAP-like repeat/FG-GAP repeat/PASTA domain
MNRRSEGSADASGARRLGVLLACVGIALTLGVAALLAAEAPSFTGARSYLVGSYPNGPAGPFSIAIGDLNGDGKPELATANLSTVSVLVNNGHGSFRASREYRTRNSAYSLAIGDLNGDGKPDLATGNLGNTVSVLLNRGDGNLRAKRDYATGKHPTSIAIGDLNGDGTLDLATGNYGNTVSVLLNGGDGSFGARRDYRAAKRPTSIAIGDLNGDGKLDLATANASTVSVRVNNGDGSFPAKRDFRTGNSASSLAIGDLNGDGKLDLATGNDGTVSVLLNRGDGSFPAKRNYPTAGNYSTGQGHVAIGDLNGDGEPDLATAHPGVGYYSVSVVSVLVNGGDGRFQARLDYAAGDSAPISIAIGDLNGDGKLDLATASPGGSVSVLRNRPGRCTVQNVAYLRVVVGLHDPTVTIVAGEKLPAAKRTLARANCRVGKIRRSYSKIVRRGRVIAQKPKFGTVLLGGGKVNLVVSRGRR